jgi:hypothetical protein
MWFLAVNEMIELLSDMSAPHFGDEYTWMRESELVPVFRFDLCEMFPRTSGSMNTPGWRPPLLQGTPKALSDGSRVSLEPCNKKGKPSFHPVNVGSK